MTSPDLPILVYGGTGQQGRALVHTLRTTGRPVRVLTRDPSNATDLAGPEVEVVKGNLADPASLRAASADVRAVVLTVPLLFDLELMTHYAVNAIEAAEAEDVSLLVYNTSMIPPDDPGDIGVFRAIHEATERVLDADLKAVVLRPPLYIDNLLAPWTLPDLKNGVVAYPLPRDLSLPWISHRNLGRYVAAALDDRGPAGTILNVAGPNRFSLTDVADTLSNATGRSFEFDALTPEAFGARVGAALGPDAGEALAGLYRAINAHPDAFFDRDFDRARTVLAPDLEDTTAWARRVLAAGQPS